MYDWKIYEQLQNVWIVSGESKKYLLETVNEPGGIEGGNKYLMAQWMAQPRQWKKRKKNGEHFFSLWVSTKKFSPDFQKILKVTDIMYKV